MKQGTAIVLCKCVNEQQDKLHGVGKRVANATAKQDSTYVEVRCTSCKAVHRVSPSQVR
jgi:hypothetical protein